MSEAYDDFAKNTANYVPLSPISFLERTSKLFANDEAVVCEGKRYTWGKVWERCRSLAHEISRRGLGQNDTIAVLAPNTPENFELHYAIPMSGAVLNTINTRLEPDTIAYILDHGEAKLVFCDTEYAPLLRSAFEILERDIPVIDMAGDLSTGGFGQTDFEDIANRDSSDFEICYPDDEWQALSLNYTSGTSGRPKGVVYHHRGAYLMSMSTLAAWSVPQRPVFLSVSPMFHCNGWGHLWAMTILGGKIVFTRNPVPALIFDAIKAEGVTHFGAAPIVLAMLAESEHAPEEAYHPAIKVMTAGAPPPPSILERASRIGFEIMQVYGLTETYGHIGQCLWRDEWKDLPTDIRSAKQAMQGVAFPMTEKFDVIDRETMLTVPWDGKTQGEIAIRGNTVMKGYFKNPEATAEAFQDGYFWSGDAAVVDAQGYVQIRDRLKDVIISGGENISSVEVEAALSKHPDVMNVAVVAMPSEKWGESPCAFVELREGKDMKEQEMIDFARENLAGFKCPKAVIFKELPKTATGKIQKFILREEAKNLA